MGIIKLSQFLKESRIPGSKGNIAKKITVKLYGKGVFAKKENRVGSENTNYFKRKAGQFIYSKLDFLNGAFGLIPLNLDCYETTVDLPCFDFISDQVSPVWFLYYVSRRDFYTYQGALGNGGRKARRISPSDFLNLEIDVPPLKEQKKIVEIISGINKFIEMNKLKLNQIENLKKSIRGNLIIKQIDNLNNISIESGKIPNEWNLKSLDEVCHRIWIGLVTTMTKFYVKKGVNLIRNSDINEKNIDINNLIQLDPDFSQQHNKYLIKTDDVVTVHTGDVGTSCVISNDISPAQGFATLNSRLNKELVLPEFYSYYLNSDFFKIQIRKVVTGDGRNNLNLKEFLTLMIVFPSIPEQKKIIKVLSSIDSVLEKLQKKITKLETLHTGLTQDFLTGRKRVDF